MEKKQEISITTGTIVRAIMLVILTLALFKLKSVILIVLTSIVIASFVQAMARKMTPLKIPRVLGVVFIYLLTLFISGIFLYFFVPILLTQIRDFIVYISPYISQEDILRYLRLESLINFEGIVSGDGNFLSNARDVISAAGVGFIQTTSVLFGGGLNILLIAVISFYLSIQERGVEQFLRIVSPLRHEAYVIDLWRRTERKIGLWVQGQVLLGFIIGVITYLGLLLFGLKYALLVAIFAGLLELIPFGMILAVIPAVTFAYAQGGIALAIGVALFYLLVQQLENYVITPLVIKRIIGIPAVVVILALLIGATLAGFWGVILAVPVAVAVLEFMNDVEQKKVFARNNYVQ